MLTVFKLSDENSKNELTAVQANSITRSNPIKSGMLRPSALQSGLAAATSSSSVTSKSSLLRPASFQVGSTTDDATSSALPTSTAANPFAAVLNTSTETENEAKPKQTENGSTEKTEEVSIVFSNQFNLIFNKYMYTIETTKWIAKIKLIFHC